MITVRLNGGLGNQMFQYAIAKAIAYKNNTEVVLDINEFDKYKLRDFELDKYNIKAKVVNKSYTLKRVLKKVKLTKLIKKYYIEKSLSYDKNLLKVLDNSYIEGYFQSEKYFKAIRNEILQDFTINRDLSNYTKKMKEKIENSHAISLHIRRGDYVANKHTNKVHGVCELDYYKKAIEYFDRKFKDNKYFVFSDDIKWCKENFKIKNVFYIENEEKRIPHEDIYLMSLCKHNIIANSSFSWWGAWLNKNSKKIVIAPKRWFLDEDMNSQAKDIVCENWIKI